MLRKSPAREATRTGRAAPDPSFCFAGADRLVALGFRHWMLGYQTGEIACWEAAWREFSGVLGPAPARAAVGDLSCWVRTIARLARRPIKVYPDGCRRFCRDECMAVSMVAASQHEVCPAMRACAFALIEHSDVEEVVAESAVLAERLKRLGQVLSTASIANAAALSLSAPSTAHH
ncbi:MAG: hypothetical protein R3D27_05495 [Hyphomicrobiaceae bacterium]